MVDAPTKIHLTFLTDASGSVLIDKASPEPFVGSAEFVRADAVSAFAASILCKQSDAEGLGMSLAISVISEDHALCSAFRNVPEGFQFLGKAVAAFPPSPSEKGVG